MGELKIDRVDDLVSLDGLDSLTTVQGDVTISNNPELTDISALHGITSIEEDLYIKYNTQLTATDALLDAIGAGNIAGTTTIGDNAP